MTAIKGTEAQKRTYIEYLAGFIFNR